MAWPRKPLPPKTVTCLIFMDAGYSRSRPRRKALPARASGDPGRACRCIAMPAPAGLAAFICTLAGCRSRDAEHGEGVARRAGGPIAHSSASRAAGPAASAVAVTTLVTATPPAAEPQPHGPSQLRCCHPRPPRVATGSGKASPPTMRVRHRHRSTLSLSLSLSLGFHCRQASRRRADARSLRAAHAAINSRCFASPDFYWVQFSVVAAVSTTLGPKQASKAAR